MALFDGTQTPELNQATLDKLLKRLDDERLLRLSQARGMAVNQGLGLGSTIEGQGIGQANKIYADAGNDAALGISTAAAESARQDRLSREAQAYQAAEQEKQRIFQANQEALNRTFQGEQGQLSRDADAANSRRSGRDSLLGGALGAGGSVLGGLFRSGGGLGSLFGVGATGANATSTGIASSLGLPAGGVGTGGAGSTGLFAPIAGAAALNLGAMGLGQKLGSQIGGFSKGANYGSKIGGLFGGPVGALTGGVVGGSVKKVSSAVKKAFCFDPTTMIEMADGSIQPISQIELGDETKGGVVLSIRRSLTEDGTRFYYKGVIVTGSHAVREGKRWTRVENSEWAQPLEGAGIVISLVTDMNRIFINGMEFADEHEGPFYEDLTIEQSLDALNAEQEEINNG